MLYEVITIFKELLNRVRIGTPTEADIKLLESRIVPGLATKKPFTDQWYNHLTNFYNTLSNEDEQLLCLFGRCEHVDTFNFKMLKVKKIQTVKISAKDELGGKKVVILKRNNFV